MATKAKSKAAKVTKSSKPAAQQGAKGRPMWSGSISFGLVNIPVRLYTGIRTKDIRFHLLHDTDKSRLQEKMVCATDQKEVAREDMVKGYEVGKGQYVEISQEEIDALAPKASRTIELVNVVDIHQIDPMYFSRPFFLVPDEAVAKPYVLLLEALRNAKKGAIVKFVMRNKEYIGAIRPIKNVLCLDTLHFADELVSIDSLPWEGSSVQLKDSEVKMAGQLIESLSGDFEPSKLHDDYREALMHLIQEKAEGKQVVHQPEKVDDEPQVIDLMEALKKSVAEVQRRKGSKAA